MIWGDIEFIGCAFIRYMKVNSYVFYLQCNYFGRETAATELYQPVYQSGAPCTACLHKRKCNKIYPNLCGYITPFKNIPKEFWLEPYFDRNSATGININKFFLILHLFILLKILSRI